MSIRRLIVPFASAVCATAASAQLPPAGFEVGRPFPAVELPALDGQVRSIREFRGTKVVLHVFASW